MVPFKARHALLATVIHCCLRPRVAEEEAPVAIWQLRDPCPRPRQRVLAGKTEAPQIFDAELRQNFVQHCFGQVQEARPMRLLEGVSHPCSGRAVEARHGCQLPAAMQTLSRELQ